MWRGRLIEVLGLGLILTAFMHFTGSTTGWIEGIAGGVIALVGTSLWHNMPRRALVTNLIGLVVLVVALIPALRSHDYNLWIAGCTGLIALVIGRRIVVEESGGPWRLKDRPVY